MRREGSGARWGGAGQRRFPSALAAAFTERGGGPGPAPQDDGPGRGRPAGEGAQVHGEGPRGLAEAAVEGGGHLCLSMEGARGGGGRWSGRQWGRGAGPRSCTGPEGAGLAGGGGKGGERGPGRSVLPAGRAVSRVPRSGQREQWEEGEGAAGATWEREKLNWSETGPGRGAHSHRQALRM